MRTKPGFSLTELLVTIAIIGLMLGLLIPMLDRSLGSNRLANDAELFKAKLEEVRLLAGSTQHKDESADSTHEGVYKYDEVGYYAIWLHSDTYRSNHYDIVRLSYPVDTGSPNAPCKPGGVNGVQVQAWQQSGDCFIERVEMSKGVELSCRICSSDPTVGNHFLAFSAPAGQFFQIKVDGNRWVEQTWVTDGNVLELTFNGKTATVKIDRYTAKASVTYD